jgi:nitrite reductase/ring-hydroxylating ferredoxin subunit
MTRYYAGALADIPETGGRIVMIKGMEIGLFRVNGQLVAWRNMCPHAGAPVCKGPVCGTKLPSLVYEYEYGMEHEVLRCPWHGWEFHLTSGEHLAGSNMKLRGFPVETEGDHVYVILA